MKRISLILSKSICVIAMVVTAVFLAIEGWLLVSGDWRLFENSSLVLIQIAVRMFAAAAAFVTSTLALIQKERSFRWAGICFLVISLVTTPFIINQLGWCFVILSILFIILRR